MFKQFFAIVFLGLVSFSYSQITSSGQCEDRTSLKPVENFSFDKYSSNSTPWYTVFTYSTPADCQYVTFTLTSDTVANLFWTRKNLTSGLWSGRSDGVVTWNKGANNEGILSLVYPDVANPLIFNVLGIDYNGYDICYRCVNSDSANRQEYIWVRSRERNLTSAQAATVQQVLVDNGIDDLTPLYAEQDSNLCSA